MSGLSAVPTATLIERFRAIKAASKGPLGSHVSSEQVDVIDGIIIEAEAETNEELACRPVGSSEEALDLLEVAVEILKDGPRGDEAGERILLSVADYLKGGGTLWDNYRDRRHGLF